MSFEANVNDLAERANCVVEIMARHFSVKPCRPFLAGLRRDFVKSKLPQARPRSFNFQQTQQSVFLAARFESRLIFKPPLERFHSFAEFRRINLLPNLLMLFQKVGQP